MAERVLAQMFAANSGNSAVSAAGETVAAVENEVVLVAELVPLELGS